MKLLKLLIIPLLLVIGYLILLSYPYFFSKINRHDSLGPLSLVEENSTNVQRTFSPERKTDNLNSHLLKGDKITSKFKASEDKLGIVLVRFTKMSGKVTDGIAFRIKKENDSKWYYENVYRAEEFQPDQYFTFGFPPISDSKNNSYIFEVESLLGTYKNGVGLSSVKPQFASVYKYSAKDLKNYKVLIPFIFKKFIYIKNNLNFLQNWETLAIFTLLLFFTFLMQKKKITVVDIIKFLPHLKNEHGKIFKAVINGLKSKYFSIEKKIIKLSKRVVSGFTSIKFYLLFFNTSTKKRIVIGLLIFLIAFLYRFSATLVDQVDVSLFYSSLGGGGDYDQFIRTATCAIRTFCPAIVGQNMPIEAPLLGTFFAIFGFTEGLKAYLYLMLILSSIVATIPHFLLSRKNWVTLGGVVGSLFLATSDFLTKVALNFPPDNGSLFTFSMFFIIYLLTLNFGTIRWVLLFGFAGLFDGMFKALLLLNDLSSLILFIPVFFYEKARKSGKSIFQKKNIKLLLLSSLPLLIFIIGYSAWELVTYIKFSAPYFLRGLLISKGSSFVIYTAFNDSSLVGNIGLVLLYLGVQAIIMLKHLIEFADLQTIFLAPIFIALLFFSFIKIPQKVIVRKIILTFILSVFLITLLTLIKNNYFKIHEIFNGDYIYSWVDQVYIGIFLFGEIIILSILNFNYSALKFTLPIITYVVMLIFMAKNAPFARLQTHVIAWNIILLAFLIDWIMTNVKKYLYAKVGTVLELFILILFIFVYISPKMAIMIVRLNSGLSAAQNEIKYLKWVDKNIPANAIILAGGKSDLVTIAENVKRPIAYNTLWNGALLIKSNEIPGVKPNDFSILQSGGSFGRNVPVDKISGIKLSDFSLIPNLQNKDNFKINKYIILEDDIFIWRNRVAGVADSVFSTSSATLLHGDDYSLKVYKFNEDLKRAIYELNIRNASANK